MDRVLASGARDESSTLSGGTIYSPSTASNLFIHKADFQAAAATVYSGCGPAAGRLVWDQEVGSSNLPAPTKTLIFAQFSFENCHHRWSFSLGLPQGMSISDLLVFSPDR